MLVSGWWQFLLQQETKSLMIEFLKKCSGIVFTVAISFSANAQLNRDCIYVDPNILMVNCGKEDRNRLSEAVYKMNYLKAKVIVLDFIFFDKRPTDSVFIKNMTCETPIILGMGAKDD